jgi:hypothetical protein
MNTIGATPADWAASFKLMTDINMAAYTGTQYNIIGNVAKPFTGTFDGAGHVIANLTYTNQAEVWYAGMFGRTGSTAVIRDLGLDNVSISVAGYYVGGLVGDSEGVVSKCYATGSVTGIDRVGGLVALNGQGVVESCCALVTVSGSRVVGGLVGENDKTLVTSYARGNVTGSDSVGGLVGYNFYGTVTDCYSTGDVSGTTNGGGLIGYNEAGTAQDSFWDIETSGLMNGVGSGTLAGVFGRLDFDMQQQVTFSVYDWDFIGTATSGTPETWRLCVDGAGYPQLNWEHVRVGDFACPDGITRGSDLTRLAADWLMTYPTRLYGADANGDGRVDFADFATMAAGWIE